MYGYLFLIGSKDSQWKPIETIINIFRFYKCRELKLNPLWWYKYSISACMAAWGCEVWVSADTQRVRQSSIPQLQARGEPQHDQSQWWWIASKQRATDGNALFPIRANIEPKRKLIVSRPASSGTNQTQHSSLSSQFIWPFLFSTRARQGWEIELKWLIFRSMTNARNDAFFTNHDSLNTKIIFFY